MKSFVRNALLGAAGLVVLSLPAHAASTTTVTDSPLLSRRRKPPQPVQLAQRPYDPSAGSVGFKKSKKKKKKK